MNGTYTVYQASVVRPLYKFGYTIIRAACSSNLRKTKRGVHGFAISKPEEAVLRVINQSVCSKTPHAHIVLYIESKGGIKGHMITTQQCQASCNTHRRAVKSC